MGKVASLPDPLSLRGEGDRGWNVVGALIDSGRAAGASSEQQSARAGRGDAPDAGWSGTMNRTPRHHSSRRASLLGLALVLIALAACRDTHTPARAATVTLRLSLTTTTTPPAMSSPTTVSVSRFSAFEGNRVAPFEKSVSDPSSVRRLYDAILSQPAYPWRYSGCPIDVGLGYLLMFSAGGALVKQVVLTGGCPTVTLSFPKECLQWTPALTDQIAATLGVPSSTLTSAFDMAGPNGPFAPEFPMPPIYAATTC